MASQDKNRPPSPPVPGPSSSGTVTFHLFFCHLIGFPQCFGFGAAWFRIDFVRLDLDPLCERGSGFRRAKITYKNGKKLLNSCFVLDVLF
jgi:hypothetical protein